MPKKEDDEITPSDEAEASTKSEVFNGADESDVIENIYSHYAQEAKNAAINEAEHCLEAIKHIQDLQEPFQDLQGALVKGETLLQKGPPSEIGTVLAEMRDAGQKLETIRQTLITPNNIHAHNDNNIMSAVNNKIVHTFKNDFDSVKKINSDGKITLDKLRIMLSSWENNPNLKKLGDSQREKEKFHRILAGLNVLSSKNDSISETSLVGLSGDSKKEAGKRFAEAFQGYQKAGHGECGPDCEFCYGKDGVKLENCVHNCGSAPATLAQH